MALRPPTSPPDGGSPGAFDSEGRPIIHEDRRIGFRRPSVHACEVLYALALTELRGNRLGLTRRSILKILHNSEHPLAGDWDWLFQSSESVVSGERAAFGALATPATVRNAIQELLQVYPITVIKPGYYVEVPSINRSKGGVVPDVHMLNDGAIERWPCGARCLKLLSVGIGSAGPISYETLAQYVPVQHSSHVIPEALLAEGARPLTKHALRDDIEFLVRSRYLKLFTHEKGDRKRREIPYHQPFEFQDSAILELDERAKWELPYLNRLALHF